jgi:hypothetical protein
MHVIWVDQFLRSVFCILMIGTSVQNLIISYLLKMCLGNFMGRLAVWADSQRSKLMNLALTRLALSMNF